jgi:hypothetical protein
MQFWKIDSWDGERAAFVVDERAVWADNFNMWSNYKINICGHESA